MPGQINIYAIPNGMNAILSGASNAYSLLQARLGSVFDMEESAPISEVSLLGAWLRGGLHLEDLSLRPRPTGIKGLEVKGGSCKSLKIALSGNVEVRGLCVRLDATGIVLQSMQRAPRRGSSANEALHRIVNACIVQTIAHNLINDAIGTCVSS